MITRAIGHAKHISIIDAVLVIFSPNIASIIIVASIVIAKYADINNVDKLRFSSICFYIKFIVLFCYCKYTTKRPKFKKNSNFGTTFYNE